MNTTCFGFNQIKEMLAQSSSVSIYFNFINEDGFPMSLPVSSIGELNGHSVCVAINPDYLPEEFDTNSDISTNITISFLNHELAINLKGRLDSYEKSGDFYVFKAIPLGCFPV